MTQTTSQIGADQSGLAYRNADNAGKQAILNHHKGNPAPGYAEAGMIWLDDTTTPWLLKFYDGADWIVLGEVNAATNTFNPYHGAAADRVLNHAADTGAANAYAVAPSPAITAYATGQIVTLKPANANTGAATINVNSLGTKNIKLLDGTNPAANALLTAGSYALMYDGANFVVLNPSQPAFVGDAGSGGAKGLVPAPSSGDAAANKVLGAGGGWVSVSSSVTLNAQSAGYTLLAADKNCIVELTGSSAQTFAFTAAATLGSGWFCFIHNNSTAALTVDPNASETIDSLTSYIMYPGEVRLVQCSGTAFTTILLNGGTATFNSSGTWTRPPGYMGFDVEIISGGSAGAVRSTTGNASGGGGGQYLQLRVTAAALVAIGSTETVTVAGTAAAVSSSNANGTAGNNSVLTINGINLTAAGASSPTHAASSSATIGGVCTSLSQSYTNGGAGGSPFINEWAGAGGAVSSGNIPSGGNNSINAPGGGGGCSSTAGGTRTGGTSLLAGAGGAGGANTGGNGTNGAVPGGGGGGAVNGGTSGSGAAGRITVRGVI